MTKLAENKKVYYGLNERPPLATIIILGLQYASTVASYLVLAVILIHIAHLSTESATSFISAIMISTAITTILQSRRWGPIGSGMLLPLSPSPAYFAPTYLAAQLGGLPLMCGMTIFGGFVQSILSLLLNTVKRFIPPEMPGLIITIIGVDIGLLGFKQLYMQDGIMSHLQHQHVGVIIFICLLPICLMFSFNLWGKRNLKLFGLMLSMIISYLIYLALGLMPSSDKTRIIHAHWLFIPSFNFFHLRFSESLVVPFIIGALIASIKVTGSLSALQQLKDPNWSYPDMNNIAKGNLADAFGTMLSGFLGGMGINASSSSMALSVTTGVLSRIISFAYAIIFLFCSLCPKVALCLIYMPKPIVMGTMLFLGTMLIYNGIKMMLPCLTSPVRYYIAGISFLFGLSHFVYPGIYAGLPDSVKSFTGSSIAVSAVAEIVLNFILMLRIEDIKLTTILLGQHTTSPQQISEIIDELAVSFSLSESTLHRSKDLLICVNQSIQEKIKVNIELNNQCITFCFHYQHTMTKSCLAKMKNRADTLEQIDTHGQKMIEVKINI